MTLTPSTRTMNGEECLQLQYWMYGSSMTEDDFNYVDSDDDGQISGEEAAAAAEEFMANMTN